VARAVGQSKAEVENGEIGFAGMIGYRQRFRYWQQEGWQRLWQLRRQPGRIEHDPRLPGHD